MNHADDDALAAIALGEPDVPAAVLAHVEGCADCAAAVEQLRHALATARLTPDAPLVAPPAAVWSAIESELDATEPPRGATPVTALPAAEEHRSRRRRAVPVWAAAAAVAAALVLGGVLGRSLATEPPAAAPTPDTVVGRADLSEVGGTAARGAAVMLEHDDRMLLRVRTTHLGGSPGGLHEVWLLNRDGSRLVSLGLLGPQGSGTFAVPAQLLREGYLTVDVSVEPDDGDPAHSGDSLARGELGLRSGA